MSGTTHTNDGAKKRWNHGATIVRGEVQFASVSSLELGGRCLRRWAFRYGPRKLQDPETDSTKRGNESHAEVAKYLTTGSRAHLSPIVASGLHQIPTPGPDLYVEYPFVPDLPDGRSGKELALLRADGIPIIGAIDLLHDRLENYGVQDITDARDEPGVIKVVDWKFVSTLKNIKEGHELIDTLQMAGYARWGFLRFPQVPKIRISHCYFPARGGRPRHTTAVVTRDQVDETWKRADAVGVSLRHAAREPDENRVDANTRDCEAYGRPCPALVAGVCMAHKVASVSEYVGAGQAERLINAASLVRPQPQPSIFPDFSPDFPSVAKAPMTQIPPQYPPQFANAAQPTAPAAGSIMAAYATAPVIAAPAAPAPAPMAPPVMSAPAAQLPPLPSSAAGQQLTNDIAAEMARLQANIAPPAPVAPAAPTLTPEQLALDDLCKKIESYNMGFPTVVGALSKAFAEMKNAQGHKNYDPNAPGYTGTGTLGNYNIPDLATLYKVLESVQNMAAQQNAVAAQAANIASPLPPETPPSAIGPAPASATPPPVVDEAAAKAAKEAEKQRKKEEKAAKKAAEEAAKKAAVEQAAAQAAAQAPVTTVNNVIIQQAPAPFAPISPETVAAMTITPAVTATTPPAAAQAVIEQVTPQAPTPPPSSTPIEVVMYDPSTTKAATQIAPVYFFVDMLQEGFNLIPFRPIVDAIWAEMARDSGFADPRMARDPNNKYSHGGWKGVLDSAIRAGFAQGKIAPGQYTYDGSFGEIGSVVVEAVRAVAYSSRGGFMKGAR